MYKDIKTMSFKAALSSLAILMGTAFAQQEGDSASVESRQTSLLEKLTNYEANALGFAINGYARAGYLRSQLDADDAVDGTQLVEASAYTHVGMTFSVRPSSESVAKFDLRFHKDWENAHREGNNSPIDTWWSYDGTSLNNHLKFNLGHMRVGYTPLTIYQPMPDFIFEPTIFSEHREYAMAEKNLDGSNDRLMQGVNLEFHSLQLGFMDDLMFRGTMARIRNVAKKNTQMFFDFDDSDRYLFAGAVGIDVMGIKLGVNDAYVFDHIRSARSINLHKADTLYHERNNVLSAQVGFDSKTLMPSPVHFGIDAEYALSYWSYLKDYMATKKEMELKVIADTSVRDDGSINTDQAYLSVQEEEIKVPTLDRLEGFENKPAIRVGAFADAALGSIDVNAKANFVKVDKEFQAEMAMSPATLGSIPVLNSDAQIRSTTLDGLLSSVRSGSLENLYFSLYESVPLQSANMLTSNSGNSIESEYYRLYNNFKYAHYYRNGYNNIAYKRTELLLASSALDPSADLALPFGYATPNRTGGDIDLTGKWNDAVALRVLAGFYNADELEVTDSLDFITGTKYMKFGGGANVDIARLLAMGKEWGIQLGGSYEMSKETDGFERTSSRMMAGLDVTWNSISLLTGFQMLNLEFGKPYMAVLEGTSEMLALGGVRYKIAAGAYATVEYGYITNSIDYIGAAGSATMDLTKNVIMADVTVKF